MTLQEKVRMWQVSSPWLAAFQYSIDPCSPSLRQLAWVEPQPQQNATPEPVEIPLPYGSGKSSGPPDDSIWDFSHDDDSEFDENPIDGDWQYQKILRAALEAVGFVRVASRLCGLLLTPGLV